MNNEKLSQITEEFRSRFGTYTHVVFAPGRANIIGEHTDYNDGLVLPFAVSQGLYFAIGPSQTQISQIFALDVQELWVTDLSAEDVPHPWCIYLLRALAAVGYTGSHFNLVFGGDLPSGAGISSSSALTCGFLYSLSRFTSLHLDTADLLSLSVMAERGSGVRGGQMDQYTIIHGLEGHAILLDCKDMSAGFISVDPAYFQFLLINTRKKHHLVSTEYNDRRQDCDLALERIKEVDSSVSSLRDIHAGNMDSYLNVLSLPQSKRVRHVVHENDRVLQMVKAIKNKDLWTAGTLLYQSHQSLSVLYEVSCPELDYLVYWASGQSNIYGARMMGGGFGGCTINLVQGELSDTQKSQLSQSYSGSFGHAPEFIYIKPDHGLRAVL